MDHIFEKITKIFLNAKQSHTFGIDVYSLMRWAYKEPFWYEAADKGKLKYRERILGSFSDTNIFYHLHNIFLILTRFFDHLVKFLWESCEQSESLHYLNFNSYSEWAYHKKIGRITVGWTKSKTLKISSCFSSVKMKCYYTACSHLYCKNRENSNNTT